MELIITENGGAVLRILSMNPEIVITCQTAVFCFSMCRTDRLCCSVRGMSPETAAVRQRRRSLCQAEVKSRSRRRYSRG